MSPSVGKPARRTTPPLGETAQDNLAEPHAGSGYHDGDVFESLFAREIESGEFLLDWSLDHEHQIIDPVLWAKIVLPTSSSGRICDESTCAQIDSHLCGRWATTRVLSNRVVTSFAIETDDDVTRQSILEFARGEARLLGVDLNSNEVLVSITDSGQ